MPVFRLYFPSILEHSHVDEEITRRLEAPREINVGPLSLVCRQQIAVLTHVLLFLRTEAACRPVITPAAGRTAYLLSRQIDHVGPIPYQLLDFFRSSAMIGQQASLIPPHREVVDEQGAGHGWIGCRVEGALERLQEFSDILLNVPNFPRHHADQIGLIGGQMSQVLSPLGMLDLQSGR